MYDIKLTAAKLRRWDKYVESFSLPRWEELPTIGLYMDQVVALMRQYLDYLPVDRQGDVAVTASSINNYVRMKLMPPPVKKRYSRVHLAYLVMICTLKQSLSMAYVKKLAPVELAESEEAVQALYSGYVERHRGAAVYFAGQVRKVGAGVLDGTGAADTAVSELITWSAVMSGFAKLMAEKILNLDVVESENPRGET